MKEDKRRLEPSVREIAKKVNLPDWVPMGAIGLYAFTLGIDDQCPIHKVKIGFSGRAASTNIVKQSDKVKGGLYQRFYNYHTSLPDGMWTMSLLVVGSYTDKNIKRRHISQIIAAELESRLKKKLSDYQNRQSLNLSTFITKMWQEKSIESQRNNKKFGGFKKNEMQNLIESEFQDPSSKNNKEICYQYNQNVRDEGNSEWYIMNINILNDAFDSILKDNEMKTELFNYDDYMDFKQKSGGKNPLLTDMKLPIMDKKELFNNELLGKMKSMLQNTHLNKKGKIIAIPREFSRTFLPIFDGKLSKSTSLQMLNELYTKEKKEVQRFMKYKEMYGLMHYKVDSASKTYQLFVFENNKMNTNAFCPNIINEVLRISTLNMMKGSSYAAQTALGTSDQGREKTIVSDQVREKSNVLKNWEFKNDRDMNLQNMKIVDANITNEPNTLKEYIHTLNDMNMHIPIGTSIFVKNDKGDNIHGIITGIVQTRRGNKYIVHNENNRTHRIGEFNFSDASIDTRKFSFYKRDLKQTNFKKKRIYGKSNTKNIIRNKIVDKLKQLWRRNNKKPVAVIKQIDRLDVRRLLNIDKKLNRIDTVADKKLFVRNSIKSMEIERLKIKKNKKLNIIKKLDDELQVKFNDRILAMRSNDKIKRVSNSIDHLIKLSKNLILKNSSSVSKHLTKIMIT